MKSIQRIACAVLCCIPLIACAFSDGPIDSQVMDASTSQPIAGAVVLATWTRYEGVIGAGAKACMHAETTVTDVQGRYHINKWGYFRNPIELLFATPFFVELRVYKAGYGGGPPSRSVKLTKEFTGELKLKKFEGTRDARLNYLVRLPFEARCEGLQTNEPLIPYFTAAYEEAKSIATPVERDQNAVRYLKCELRVKDYKKGISFAETICPP